MSIMKTNCGFADTFIFSITNNFNLHDTYHNIKPNTFSNIEKHNFHFLFFRQSAKFQKRLRKHFRRNQMLMKDTTAHSVELSMPIIFQGGDN